MLSQHTTHTLPFDNNKDKNIPVIILCQHKDDQYEYHSTSKTDFFDFFNYEKSGSTNDLENICKKITVCLNKNEKKLKKNNNKGEIKMLSSKEQINDLRKKMGFNISEIAAILRVQRPTIYGWLESNKAIPRKINQKRLNEIHTVCEKWFQKNLGHIDCYIDRPVHNGKTLFDFLIEENLNYETIYAVFEQLERIIKEINLELEKQNKFIKAYELENSVKLNKEREIKTHRSIG